MRSIGRNLRKNRKHRRTTLSSSKILRDKKLRPTAKPFVRTNSGRRRALHGRSVTAEIASFPGAHVLHGAWKWRRVGLPRDRSRAGKGAFFRRNSEPTRRAS